MNHVKQQDPEVFSIIQNELQRQRDGLEMIASENFTSRAVMEATGTVLTNKYAEGYPGKRYYGGNKFIDQIEALAIARAKQLFGAEHANVQPNAGSGANLAAYFGMMGKTGKVMGLRLDQGGHLTHGSPVNFSGSYYTVVPYGLDPATEMLDYDAIKKQAIAEKPNMIICGYTVYPRTIDFKAFREIADACGAYLMADISHIAGLVAAGEHPSPIPYADVVTTTTHKTLRGPRGAIILSKEVHAQKIDKAIFPGTQGGPLEHVIAAKAVCFKEATTPEFKAYQKQIIKNSKALAQGLIEEGFRLVSGGTDNHLVLVDLTSKNITGKEAQLLLDDVDITINKNTIPNDKQSPFIGSGIRIGTPALTTRGFNESDMKEIAHLIAHVIEKRDDAAKQKVRAAVAELCRKHPLYPDLVL